MNTKVVFKHPYFRLTENMSPISDVITLYNIHKTNNIEGDLFFHFKYDTHEYVRKFKV